ncbi:hypothetical protein OE88DRAFT_1366058 [Heliocybe sulcata]|uniref:Uncharacterized protein n=1 Tax=Heliocybe sulcata TaxID=5364 RepID=A0A5C3N8B1_9AGAM|nr:hypothetical protein OE88DRAFT_1366058 [Heliocybe sulcata]
MPMLSKISEEGNRRGCLAVQALSFHSSYETPWITVLPNFACCHDELASCPTRVPTGWVQAGRDGCPDPLLLDRALSKNSRRLFPLSLRPMRCCFSSAPGYMRSETLTILDAARVSVSRAVLSQVSGPRTSEHLHLTVMDGTTFESYLATYREHKICLSHLDVRRAFETPDSRL